MRLIDADALLNLPFERMIHTDFGETSIPIEEIETAPTVSEITKEKLSIAYEQGYEDGKNNWLQEEKPHGEWIDICTLPVIRECSLCGVEQCGEQTIYDNFCPNCGADMRKGGKEVKTNENND